MKIFRLMSVVVFSILVIGLGSCADDDCCDEPLDVLTEVTFTKTDGADPAQAESQDRITDHVWITRGNSASIYNIAKEAQPTSGCGHLSPTDTEWALGTTQDLSNLTFDSFANTIDCRAKEVPGKKMVLHLITDDLYFDVVFHSWTSGGGGGFSYTRTLMQ